MNVKVDLAFQHLYKCPERWPCNFLKEQMDDFSAVSLGSKHVLLDILL